MTVPDTLVSLLQNGGTCLMVVLVLIILVFAPLVYLVVLSDGPAHTRLVDVMDAFGRLIQSSKRPRKK
jgi:hypothetical protein